MIATVSITLVSVCQEEEIQFLYNENTAKQSDNIMDKWIQSFTQSLIQFFKAEMDGEDTHTFDMDISFEDLIS